MAYTREFIARRNDLLGELDKETFGMETISMGLFSPKLSRKSQQFWIAADALDADIFAAKELSNIGGDESEASHKDIYQSILRKLTDLRLLFESKSKSSASSTSIPHAPVHHRPLKKHHIPPSSSDLKK